MSLLATGTLKKLHSSLNDHVSYQLPVGDELIALNQFIGQSLTLTHTGNIYCC